jgi:hypothetical protein
MALKIMREGAAFPRFASLNKRLVSAWNDFEIAVWNWRALKLGAAGASDRATVWMFGGNSNRHDLYYLCIRLPGKKKKKELLNNRLKAELLRYVPPGYPLNNPTFCQHSVFTSMCFVRI